jgi:SAM-dependent methyltransferase
VSRRLQGGLRFASPGTPRATPTLAGDTRSLGTTSRGRMTKTGIEGYYARRAPEFDAVYDKPERQADLCALRDLAGDLLAGHDVLELACGTGYWTQAIAGSARSVTATDISTEMLSQARVRCDFGESVDFAVGDAWRPQDIDGDFTAALAAFWWSHVPVQDLSEFLQRLSSRLGPGALLVFMDNRFVEGSSTPIANRDAGGNSYQMRSLLDGSTHHVLKNFPDPDEISGALGRVGEHVELRLFDYYWCAWCRAACGA